MMMINNVRVNYKKSGMGSQAIILLHGWGQSTVAFKPVEEHLSEYFTVYNIDLPGFGESEEPKEIWDTGDYAQFLSDFIKRNDIDDPILIGHSFGGRVSLKYASQSNRVKKLILVDSAGIVREKTFKQKVMVKRYKFFKSILKFFRLSTLLQKLQEKSGSQDYRDATPIMRQVLVKVVNEDLRHEMPNISVPTLLIWGTNDTDTPLDDAKIMEEYIRDSGIATIEGAGHYSYLENLPLFLKIVDYFVKEDR